MVHTPSQVATWKSARADFRLRKTVQAVKGVDQIMDAANASIKPEPVSIEGLARHTVSLHVQQAGSVNFVLTTC